MDKSIFSDKKKTPDKESLEEALGTTYHLWEEIADYTYLKFPSAMDEWNYPGDKYGWSFRIKDKKRVIVYLLPRDGFFKVALVFGQKATDEILKSKVNEKIKAELQSAKVYAEGRGIRIDIRDKSILNDIKRLIEIKLAN